MFSRDESVSEMKKKEDHHLDCDPSKGARSVHLPGQYEPGSSQRFYRSGLYLARCGSMRYPVLGYRPSAHVHFH